MGGWAVKQRKARHQGISTDPKRRNNKGICPIFWAMSNEGMVTQGLAYSIMHITLNSHIRKKKIQEEKNGEKEKRKKEKEESLGTSKNGTSMDFSYKMN